MELTIDIKERHKEAHKKLTRIANPVIARKGLKHTCTHVGDRLDISFQTVINYLSGRCKDGFLTEAITNEFQNLS